jgi:hypothetical protein
VLSVLTTKKIKIKGKDTILVPHSILRKWLEYPFMLPESLWGLEEFFLTEKELKIKLNWS